MPRLSQDGAVSRDEKAPSGNGRDPERLHARSRVRLRAGLVSRPNPHCLLRGFDKGDVGDPFLIDLGTDEVTRITHSHAYDHQVAWAPDGEGIVFERDFPRSSTILTVDADGSSLERLTRGGFFDTGPAFSPRGGRIVFGTDRGGEFFPDLWLMRADGSHLHRLLHMRFAESFPDWQPIAG